MSRAKPLSLEVKVERVLSLLQEKNEPYTLKELERICQKEKGVVPQSIKEVLDILVSENKAKEKKIGASKFFWSFLSDIKIAKETQHRNLVDENTKLEEQKKALIEEISIMNQNRASLPDREEKLSILDEKRKAHKEIMEIAKSIEDHDPSKIKALSEELSSLQTDLSEWADAFNILQSHIKNTCNLGRSEFCKTFSISMSDLDIIEDL